jgi:hypothetical protein
MKISLLPITKFAVLVSGVVPFVFAMVSILSPALTHRLFWPPPLEPMPLPVLRFTAASYLGFTAGMAYVLVRNDWRVASAYLVTAGTYNALSVVVALWTALTPPGVPLIMWLYVVLALIYLGVLVIAWRQQTASAG